MKRSAGLTIIEVLVAIAVLGIVMAALAYMQVSTIRMTGASQKDSEAMQVAIRAVDAQAAKILLDAATFESYANCPGPVHCTSSLQGAEGQISINASSSEVGPGLIRITVDVTSPGRASLSYLVSCMDLHPVPTVAEPYPCPNDGGS
jgi:prepilin-type N-terminal cleavage/methylation domain-containing protein